MEKALMSYQKILNQDDNDNTQALKQIQKSLDKLVIIHQALPNKINKSKKIDNKTDPFYTIYDKYIAECEAQQLTDKRREEYTQQLAKIIENTQQEIEKLSKDDNNTNVTEEDKKALEHLQKDLKDY